MRISIVKGDVEVAAGHKIVKEVCEELKEESVNGISVLEYLRKKVDNRK